MERRLTAILAADVVGYSRLMEADETATLMSLKAHRDELLEPEIAGHNGRIVKLMGDGVLAEFASVVDAVNCAVELQRGTAARNDGVPQDRRIVFRIGINLGDVIVEGNDIYGDGVNVAARLEGLAEPGGICLSATVHDHIAGKVSLNFEDGGEHKVKNLTRPVHVWRWRDQSGEPPRPALALPSKPSIAVLPFDNLSGDPEQAYFADGIAEDIITALSRIRWFFVIARNSSFAYKGKSVDVRQVAQELGVRYLLEGSVRKAGTRVRLSAQLIDGATGNHIWAERFDREMVDIFDLQDELTQTIAGAIEPALSQAERQRAKAKRPESLDAWDVYQQGMSHLHRRTELDLAEAADLFGRASEADPGLVSAYASASECRFFQIVGGFAEGLETARQTGLAMARTAVDLDQQDAGARYALGRIYIARREHDLAIPELTRAIEFNPSYALGPLRARHGLRHLGARGRRYRAHRGGHAAQPARSLSGAVHGASGLGVPVHGAARAGQRMGGARPERTQHSMVPPCPVDFRARLSRPPGRGAARDLRFTGVSAGDHRRCGRSLVADQR